LSPGDLGEILKSIHSSGGDLLVGFETADDAGVYRLDGERAVISTADFITPVVDARRWWTIHAASGAWRRPTP
jgi:selenide,water dikinase